MLGEFERMVSFSLRISSSGDLPFRLVRRFQGRDSGGRARWTIVNTDMVGIDADRLYVWKRNRRDYRSIELYTCDLCLWEGSSHIVTNLAFINVPVRLPSGTSRSGQTDTQGRKRVQGHLAGTSHGGGECEALRLLLGCPREKYTIVQEARVGLVGLDGGGLQVWSGLQCRSCLLRVRFDGFRVWLYSCFIRMRQKRICSWC